MADCEELVQCPPGYKLRITRESLQAWEGLDERKNTHIEEASNLRRKVWSAEHRAILMNSALILLYALVIGFVLHEQLASVEALLLVIICFLLTALYTGVAVVSLRQYRRMFELVYDTDKVLIRQMNLKRREMMVEEEELRVVVGAGEETSYLVSYKSQLEADLVERICEHIAGPLTEYWCCSRVWYVYYWIALYGGLLCMQYPVRYILGF